MTECLKKQWLWAFKKIKRGRVQQWLIALGLAFLALSCFVFLAGIIGYYLMAAPPMFDLGFWLVPAINVSFLDRIGFIVGLIFFVIAIAKQPHRSPYFCFVLGVWIMLRTIATVLTAFPSPDLFYSPPHLDPGTLWNRFVMGLGTNRFLYFSGHVGLPYLGFLIFRDRAHAVTSEPEKLEITMRLLFWPLGFMMFYYIFIFSKTFEWSWGSLFLLAALIILIFRKKTVRLSTVCLLWSLLMVATQVFVRGHYLVDIAGAYITTGWLITHVFTAWWPFKKLLPWLEHFCDHVHHMEFKTED